MSEFDKHAFGKGAEGLSDEQKVTMASKAEADTAADLAESGGASLEEHRSKAKEIIGQIAIDDEVAQGVAEQVEVRLGLPDFEKDNRPLDESPNASPHDVEKLNSASLRALDKKIGDTKPGTSSSLVA